jgi:hypothetical protein
MRHSGRGGEVTATMHRDSGRRAAVALILLMALGLTSWASGSLWPAAEADRANPDIAVQDQVDVYTLVIRRTAGLEDPNGHPVPRKGTVYVVRTANDAAGEPPGNFGSGMFTAWSGVFTPEVQHGVSAALADLPAKIEWVETFKSVEWTAGHSAVRGGGQIVELGSIIEAGANTVHVEASSKYGSLGACGTTYVVRKTGGKWTITGTTGGTWMSWAPAGLSSAST